jgi:uncharacterized protein YeaO (DUF488 family)
MLSMPTAKVLVARVYDPPTVDGGLRVLVDRLWPRGLSRSAAALDDWCRAVVPSNELRRWFGHEPARLEEFISRYKSELTDPDRASALVELKQLGSDQTLTLLTATKDLSLSHAPVLARIIEVARPKPSP